MPSPVLSGLRCRCPRCGKGKLFKSYLKLADACSACGLNYSRADSGDGPAVFVIFLVAPIVLVLALVVGSFISLPPYIHLMLWIPTTVLLSLALLPPFKGVLVAQQFTHVLKGHFDE